MNIINSISFYITAILLILFTILIIVSKKMMNCIIYSLIVFFLTGLIFISLNAPLNGTIQICIYVVAMSILFAISVMFTNYKTETYSKIKLSRILTIIAAVMIVYVIITALNNINQYDLAFNQYLNSPHILTYGNNTKQLCSELLIHNTLSFEILGLYLLTALTGICVLFTFKGGR